MEYLRCCYHVLLIFLLTEFFINVKTFYEQIKHGIGESFKLGQIEIV